MSTSKNVVIVTKQSIIDTLSTRDRAFLAHYIGRALVALFANQTRDEQATNSTRRWNEIGFTGADGHSGSLTAKYYLKHRSLQDWQIDMWMKEGKRGPRLAKYWRQLNQAALARKAAG